MSRDWVIGAYGKVVSCGKNCTPIEAKGVCTQSFVKSVEGNNAAGFPSKGL